MQVHFIGTGDALGSGGRLNTCFLVKTAARHFLIDCGASSMIGLQRDDVDRNRIDLILITHFHLDHFGGIPPFILDAQFVSKRTTPLTIAGPPGLPEWYARIMETAFPGSSATVQKFKIDFVELSPAGTRRLGDDLVVTAVPVDHGPGGPFFAYRVETAGKSIAYTGDTQWTKNLLAAGKDADLFIAECYFMNKQVPFHLDLTTLESHLEAIAPRRLILTHMSSDVLSQVDDIPHQAAHDGLVLEI